MSNLALYGSALLVCLKPINLLLIFAMVGIGHILDTQVIGNGSVLRTATIFFYLSNEGVSLAENASYLGLPIPVKLKAVLQQLHDRSESEEGQ